MLFLSRLSILLLFAVCASGCTIEPGPYTLKKSSSETYIRTPPRPDLIGSNYKATEILIDQVRTLLPADAPMIVSTVVNINRLENSAPLGRVITEHVLGRLAQSGFGVIELKIRDQIYMKRHEGEFLLTREVRDLVRSHKAQAMIVGTYAEASDRIFISLKVIEAEGNRIIGAVDYSVFKDEVVRSMLLKKEG